MQVSPIRLAIIGQGQSDMLHALPTERQAELDADLIAAIKASETATVISLLEQGANPNVRVAFDPYGYGPQPTSALMLALTWASRKEAYGSAEERNDTLVRALIDGGARLTIDYRHGATPLSKALDPNRYDLMVYMLDRGADINETYYGSLTVLSEACAWGAIALVNFLLERGAEIDPQTVDASPLMHAIQAKQKEVVALLLSRGADVHYYTCYGLSALTEARGNKKVDVEIRRMLEAASAQPDRLEEEYHRLLTIVEKAVVLDTTTLDRWKELREAYLEGENFADLPLHHAHMLCYLGISIAKRQGDYAAAMELIDRLFSHPKTAYLDPTTYSILFGYLYDVKMYCLLKADQEAEAIALARQLLHSNVAGRALDSDLIGDYFPMGRQALEDYFETMDAQDIPVSRELTDLTWDVFQRCRRRPLKRRRLPDQATPHELYTLLQRRG